MKLTFTLFLCSIMATTTLLLFGKQVLYFSMPGNALPFPPSGDRGSPRSTTGGGTRGAIPTSCLLPEGKPATLVALMPNRENSSKTATGTPSFYWYIPETKSD